MAIYGVNPLSEAITPHGQTFRKTSDIAASGNQKTSSSGDDGTTYGTTSLGRGGVLDSVARHHIEDIDLEKEKAVSESTNVLYEYALYINGKLNEAIKQYGDPSKSQLEKRMVEDLARLEQMGLDDMTRIKLITDEYYGGKYVADENMSEEEASKIIKTVLRMRINYVNKITSLLSKMLRLNYKTLGLSEEQAKIYIDSLTSGTNDSVKTAGEVRELIKKNADKFMINNGEAVDLRPLGFGVIFGPSGVEKLNFIGTDGSNKDAMLTLLQKAMRYDAVVVAHGGNGFQRNKKSDEIINNIKNELYNSSILIKYEDELNNIIDSISNKSGFNNRRTRSIINNFVDKFKDIYDLYDLIKPCAEYVNPVYAKNKDEKETADTIIKFVLDNYKNISDKKFQSIYNMIINNYKSKIEIELEEIEELRDNDYIKRMNDSISIIEKYKNEFKRAFDLKIIFNIEGYIEESLYTVTGIDPIARYWSCQPTRTLKAGPFEEVNELIRQLIKEGFKKICIEDCNPGGHEIAKDILATKGILITYSKFSNFVESSEIDINDPDIIAITEAENSLIEFAKSYNIDYTDDIFLEESYQWYLENIEVINEGIGFIDSLKEFFEKVVAGIIAFFKKVFNLVKVFITKVKQLFTGKPDETPKDTQTKFEKPVKGKLADPKSKKMIEFNANNREEINKIASTVASEIAKEIKEVNSKHQRFLKSAESKINELEKDAMKTSKTESFIDKFLYDADEDLLDITESLLLEFEDENGVVEDDDDTDDEYSVDGDTDDTPEEPAQDSPETAEEPEEDTEYSMDDAEGETEETPEPANEPATADAGEQPGDGAEAADDAEYSMDDAEATDDTADTTTDDQGGTEEQPGDGQDSGDDDNYEIPDDEGGEGTEQPGDGAESGDDAEYSMDDGGESTDGGDAAAADTTNTATTDTTDTTTEDPTRQKLNDLESVVFDTLSEPEKTLKIKELKELYTSIYKKCDVVYNSLTDIRRDEETIQIIEYISNTLIDLKRYVGDYIINLFDVKTYVENLAQLQKYIMIFTAINQVFEQIRVENDK